MRSFKPGQNIKRQQSPRVLVHYRYYEEQLRVDELVEQLSATVPTVRKIRSLGEVNLNEWDCIVTWDYPGEVKFETVPGPRHENEGKTEVAWAQRFPGHLSVICFVRPSHGLEPLDAWPAKGESDTIPPLTVVAENEIVGEHLTYVEGLPDLLEDTVRKHLVPIVARRGQTHLTFRTASPENAEAVPDGLYSLRPFLYGPDDAVLACSYQRTDRASVWLLPDDLPDLYVWAREALREWHGLYPNQFPLVPDWHQSSAWYSTAEREIAARQEVVTTKFEAAYRSYEAAIEELDAELLAARKLADQYERALVTADGEPLVRAVARAFEELGFRVEDMDKVFEKGSRREDLRVYDDIGDANDWVAIVEVKGFRRGTRETELSSVGRHAEKFIVDNGRPPSARWFVSNHHRNHDPKGRPVPFADKPEVPASFNMSQGTIIDSRALFDLIALSSGSEELKSAARALLKSSPPVVGRVTADELGVPPA